MAHASAGAVFLLAVTFADVAQAQQSAVIEGVTVWAQKRESALSDVPMSVTALSADDLATAGLNTISDVADYLPTLDLQSSASATTTSLRIRRVGNIGNIPTFEPAVGLFVDGAFRSRSLLGTADLLDVERVEVLAGPQSTLYGKNVSGGVVALYTRAPNQGFDGRVEATSGWLDAPGSPSLMNLKLALSGPLSSTVGGSLAVSNSRHGHTWANALADSPDGNDDDRLATRGQLSWSPSDSLSVRLLVGYAQEKDEQTQPDVFFAPGAPSSVVADFLRTAGLAGTCGDNIPHNRRGCAVSADKLDLEAVDVTLLGSYRFANGWTLTSITAWDRYEALRNQDDVLQLSGPVLFFRDSEEGRSLQEELRLSSGEGAVQWLAGLFLYRHDYDRGMNGQRPMFGTTGPAASDAVWPVLLGGIPLAAPDQLGLHDSHVDTRHVSAFGNVEWQLTERLALMTGLRWQREEKRGAISNSVTVPGPSLISLVLTPVTSPSGAPVNGALARDSDDVTWSLTPHYRFSDTLMSYLTVARGAKSGGFNTGFGNAPLSAREFGDEHVEHYEIGARGTYVRGRFSAAAFHTEYEDYQDAAFVAAQFTVGNASKVVSQGVEVEGALLVGERLTVDFALSLVDLKYDVNRTGMCYPGRTPDGTLPGSCDLSGEHPIQAPLWSTHLGAQYERDTPWATLYARVDWSWTDRYSTSFSADPRLVQEPYDDVALRLGARFGDRYEVVLWGENLLDEVVTHFDAVLSLFNDASYQSYLAAPRSYGATIRVRF